MLRNEKGLSAALTLVVASAVLIVVALIVISMTSGGLGKFFKGSEEIAQADVKACSACIYGVCSGSPTDTSTPISTIASSGSCKSVCGDKSISCNAPSNCKELILDGKALSCK